MRDLTFDMIGMSLMTIAVGVITFGLVTLGYFKEIRSSTAPPSARQAGDTAASKAVEARDQRDLVGHR
jgi:hypothetical protein